MLVEITGSCGHTKEKDLKNRFNEEPTTRQLNKSIAYWSEKVCSDCYMGNISQKMERFGTLPELVGSEKQVNWATKIRQAQLLKVNEWLATLNSKEFIRTLDLANDKEFVRWHAELTFCEEKAKLVASITDAKFWIDTRDEEGVILLGTVDGQDRKVKLDLETGEVVLSTRGNTKEIEFRGRGGEIVTMQVGGKKFYDKQVNTKVGA